jgi:tRNA threonylcarbamoyladenosine biosynthesis protein TsaB
MNNAPLILSIETATLSGSVSLTRGSEVITTVTGDKEVSHSNTLLAELDNVLSSSEYALSDVDLFAVAIGPGSFTGLRIGIATVKGLAFTLHKLCIGIPTLHAVAHSAGPCGRVVAVLPAGRGEVFVQMFEVSSDDVIALDQATHVRPSEMLQKYSQFRQICWCGEGVNIHHDLILMSAQQLQLSELSEWKLLPNRPTLAEDVGMLAYRKFRANELQSPESLSAMYVRPSDAELKSKTAE